MRYKTTTALKKILRMKRRLRIIQGGTRAGKTIAIILILIDLAQTQKGKIISVVSESMPHLKRGAIRDFLDIMKNHGYFKDKDWNKTDRIYTFSTGTIIEFIGADQPQKVRGHKRDVLFINECNNVSYEIYTQLAIRTTGFIYLDYNPVSEFWVNVELLTNSKNYNFEIFTYKDNEFLDKQVIKEIESRKGNKNFWKVYGLGLLGEAEGRIHTGWKIVDSIPHEARLERYGLDFGYSNDPTAIVAIYYYNGGYILDEVTFLKSLSNKHIADILLNVPKALTIADKAEPKSIDEIGGYGLSVQASRGGQGSVLQGIQYVQDQQISVTKRSLNVLKEYRNYLWETDRDGKIINVPEHTFSHSMDAIRYGMESLRPSDDDEDFPDDTKKFAVGGFY